MIDNNILFSYTMDSYSFFSVSKSCYYPCITQISSKLPLPWCNPKIPLREELCFVTGIMCERVTEGSSCFINGLMAVCWELVVCGRVCVRKESVNIESGGSCTSVHDLYRKLTTITVSITTTLCSLQWKLYQTA